MLEMGQMVCPATTTTTTTIVVSVVASFVAFVAAPVDTQATNTKKWLNNLPKLVQLRKTKPFPGCGG